MAENSSFTESNIVCYSPTMITTNGIWQGDNPLAYSLPLFILQVTLVVLTTRTLVFVFRPLRQPKVVAEILGGILLGPSVLGRYKPFTEALFPLRSIMVLETMANIGLLYFLFLTGIEMDITVIKRTGKKSVKLAVAGMALPFIVSIFTSFVIKNFITERKVGDRGSFLLFLCVALSVTAFPVLARVLAELKLLNTDLGRLAMSAALINDMCAWILLAVAIAMAENSSTIASLWVILSGTGFVLFCLFAVRPAVMWLVRRTPDGETVSELYLCIILTGVMVSGFVTDAIGIHSIFGAFVFGLVIPEGPLGAALVEKLEDFVSGLLLPLFFAISGLRTDVSSMRGITDGWGLLVLIILLASGGKVLGTMILASSYNMSMREGLSLGILMNTKGLIEIIVLNVGRDQKVLDDESFAVMVLMSVILTTIITPSVTALYKPVTRLVPYKRRTIQRSKPDGELRLLACIHGPRNVPSFINLMEATHPTKRSPIFVHALHLVELTGRASAMLIVHNTRRSSRPALNRTQAHSDHIVNAFEQYERHASGVSVQPLTAISPYSSMHEDICNIAEDKRVALIILPFHKEQMVDGGMEATNPAFRSVNQNVFTNAPCSVAVLVDRGLGGTNRATVSHVSHSVVMLYFGGPDDREALSYAGRMVEHPGISLTVIRFIPGDNVVEPMIQPDESKILSVVTDMEMEQQLDDEFLNDFRLKNVSDETVAYMEKVVNNGEETVGAIRELDNTNDLYVVGRGQGMVSPLTAGLTDWSECPELGAIGDLLSSSDFTATVSVLVIQQYVGTGKEGNESPGLQMDMYMNSDRRAGRASTVMQQRPHSPEGFSPNWSSSSPLGP
ncbi:cation/H(+) antiporter 15-like [Aristolochia californica]|uniref:cation/H(+) antiporter 15-like n=1 Tax=Aristolochia californica TaxID=171875 RepID=UPI0035DE9C8F